MNVSHLQKHIGSLAEILKESGGTKIADELLAIHAALDPFSKEGLKGFADFLVRAEQYRAGGEVPIKAKPSRARAPGTRGAAKPDAQALAFETRELYDRVAQPEVTTEMVDALMAKLNKLTVNDLAEVVGAKLGIHGLKAKKTKAKILDGIRSFIMDRKGGSQRAALTEPAGFVASAL